MEFRSSSETVVRTMSEGYSNLDDFTGEESTTGLGQQVHGQRQWPSLNQLRVAIIKLKSDLEELQSPVRPGGAMLDQEGESQSLGRTQRSVGSGPLAYYHRGVAVRMLTDYLRDLVVLNFRQLEDAPENLRQLRLKTVQRRVEEYRVALENMIEANLTEPNGQLTWEERNVLKRMLEDYSRGLEEFLDDPDEHGGRDNLEDQLAVLRADIDLVDLGMPEDFSETRFDAMTDSLSSSLEGCETSVLEFSQLRDQGFKVFKLQCEFLVETLSPTANDKLRQHKEILKLVKDMEVEGYAVSVRHRIFKSIAFCIESLSELARMFQSVLDILTMCISETWWFTALKLSNARPQFATSRWSPFFLAIRACDWSMDIVELAFHALRQQLLDGESTLLDVVFKWSDEQCRMVLEINGRPLHEQDGRAGLLPASKDLESKDVGDLIKKLVELKATPPKRFTFVDTDLNMHIIADFLSLKLDGPIPDVNSLPYTFRIRPSTLRFHQYIDSGASGMVAQYTWLGQRVAVKTIKSPGLSRKRFEEEAAILATVQHPNVVRMIGCAFDEKIETGFLVMELMEHDLQSVIQKRCPKPEPGRCPFPLIVAIDIMLQIAEGMLYLREHKILHRDLKAKNVLINRCRRVKRSLSSAYRKFPDLASLLHSEEYYLAKLADFGIAKARPVSSLTLMAGTTPWRAPEVFNVPDLETDHHYKWSADVYSFAMTCYEILTGRVPFEGVPNTRIYESIKAGDRPSLGDVSMSPTLRDLIQRCWATDPNERPTFAVIVKSLWQCKVENILPVFRLHLSPSRTQSLQ